MSAKGALVDVRDVDFCDEAGRAGSDVHVECGGGGAKGGTYCAGICARASLAIIG